MPNELDLEEFERLSGTDFIHYCLRMKDLQIDDDFLKYFASRKNQWDLAHLELAVWWLGKKESLPAYQELANLIDNPHAFIRFLAIGFIVAMKSQVDAQIMSRVIEALEKNPEPANKQSLNSVLRKPASEEGRHILQRYLSKKTQEAASQSGTV